jgi:hypothetical protein
MGAGVVEEATYRLRTTSKYSRMQPLGVTVDAFGAACEGR